MGTLAQVLKEQVANKYVEKLSSGIREMWILTEMRPDTKLIRMDGYHQKKCWVGSQARAGTYKSSEGSRASCSENSSRKERTGAFFKHSFLAQSIDVLTQWHPSLIFHHSWVHTCKLEQHECTTPDFTARQHTLPGNQLKTDTGTHGLRKAEMRSMCCFYSIWYLTAKIEALCSPEQNTEHKNFAL